MKVGLVEVRLVQPLTLVAGGAEDPVADRHRGDHHQTGHDDSQARVDHAHPALAENS